MKSPVISEIYSRRSRAEMMGRVQAWAEGDGARAYGEVTAHFLRAAVAKMLANLSSSDG